MFKKAELRMKRSAFPLALMALSASLLAVATHADVILIPSDLRVQGQTDSSTAPPPQHLTANTLPFTGTQSLVANGFVTSSDYDFFDLTAPSSFRIQFNLDRNDTLVGNQSESAGNIFFQLTADTA